MPDASLRPPAGIDAELLAELMEKVSEFGSTGDGGVDRPALTDAHKAARDWFATQMRARGYRVLVDRIGNLFGRIDLAGPDAPLVMIGFIWTASRAAGGSTALMAWSPRWPRSRPFGARPQGRARPRAAIISSPTG